MIIGGPTLGKYLRKWMPFIQAANILKAPKPSSNIYKQQQKHFPVQTCVNSRNDTKGVYEFHIKSTLLSWASEGGISNSYPMSITQASHIADIVLIWDIKPHPTTKHLWNHASYLQDYGYLPNQSITFHLLNATHSSVRKLLIYSFIHLFINLLICLLAYSLITD